MALLLGHEVGDANKTRLCLGQIGEMAARSRESPMDFTYQTQHTISATSPFHFSSFASSLEGETQPRKRHFLETQPSPTRNMRNSTQLRAPDNKPFYFSTPNTAVLNNHASSDSPSPAMHKHNNNPFKSEKFHTPRIEEDIPTSPDTDGLNKADNEATPDSTTGQDSSQQPLKFGTSFSKQFGVRSKSKALVDSLMARKVRRRRILSERAFWNGEDQSNQVAETDGRKGSWDVGVHRDLPYIASGYLQLAFNLSLVLVLLYIIYGFIRTIQRDVDMKVEEYSVEILGEMRECSKQYLENKCHPEHRVPAMNNACLIWERCMNRDPAVVGRARVSAETFALIINSFIEPISYKTMVASNSNFCFKLIIIAFLCFVGIWFSGSIKYRIWILSAKAHYPRCVFLGITTTFFWPNELGSSTWYGHGSCNAYGKDCIPWKTLDVNSV